MRENQKLIDGIRQQETLDEMSSFWLDNKQHIYNTATLITKDDLEKTELIGIAITYLSIILEIHNTDGLASIRKQFKANNEASHDKLELVDLDLFMNECCSNLSSYYFKKSLKDNEDVFHKIGSEILLVALDNAIKITNCFLR